MEREYGTCIHQIEVWRYCRLTFTGAACESACGVIEANNLWNAKLVVATVLEFDHGEGLNPAARCVVVGGTPHGGGCGGEKRRPWRDG